MRGVYAVHQSPGRIDLNPGAQIDFDPGVRAKGPAAERRASHDPRRQSQRTRKRDIKFGMFEAISLARRKRLDGVALDLFPLQISVSPFADLARNAAAVLVFASDLFRE